MPTNNIYPYCLLQLNMLCDCVTIYTHLHHRLRQSHMRHPRGTHRGCTPRHTAPRTQCATSPACACRHLALYQVSGLGVAVWGAGLSFQASRSCVSGAAVLPPQVMCGGSASPGKAIYLSRHTALPKRPRPHALPKRPRPHALPSTAALAHRRR